MAMRICGYPEWSLKEEELSRKRQFRKEKETMKGLDQAEEKKSKQYAVLPYMKWVIEKLQRTFEKHDISLYGKESITIRNTMVGPKEHQTLANYVWLYTKVGATWHKTYFQGAFFSLSLCEDILPIRQNWSGENLQASLNKYMNVPVMCVVRCIQGRQGDHQMKWEKNMESLQRDRTLNQL